MHDAGLHDGYVHMITTHATPKQRVIANARHGQQALLGDLQGKNSTVCPALEIAVAVPARKQRLRHMLVAHSAEHEMDEPRVN